MHDFTDRQVSLGTIVLTAGWIAGTSLIVAACLELLPLPYVMAGFALVKVCCLRLILREVRQQREALRDAFELGRESMRLVRD